MKKWWQLMVVAAVFSAAAFGTMSRTSFASGAIATQVYLPLVFQTFRLSSWTPTGTMVAARSLHTATLLPNSQVLVTGGIGGAGGKSNLRTAELYDPPTGTWLKVPKMITGRSNHTATLLHGTGPFPGQVLLAGGIDTGASLNLSERYDTVAATWSPTANTMALSRSDHTATLLPNGKVLVAGGLTGMSAGPPAVAGAPTNGAELFDSGSDTWSTTGSLITPRYNHTATLLTNGKVLVTGGYGLTLNPSGVPIVTYVNSAELYDPATGRWSQTGSMTDPRAFHTATLLPNGLVLVAGGTLDSTHVNAELYNPATGVWTSGGTMSTSRYFHTATLLQNGKVLVAGGGIASVSYATAELYDPNTGRWTSTVSLVSPRQSHTATLLPSGDVLAVGGSINQSGTLTPLATAELYSP